MSSSEGGVTAVEITGHGEKSIFYEILHANSDIGAERWSEQLLDGRNKPAPALEVVGLRLGSRPLLGIFRARLVD